MSGPSSNEASYGTLVRGSSSVTAVTADGAPTPPKVVALDLQPPSPDDRAEEQPTAAGAGADGCGKGDDDGDGDGDGEGTAVVDGGVSGGGGGAGLTLSDDGLESEVDVLGVRRRSRVARVRSTGSC